MSKRSLVYDYAKDLIISGQLNWIQDQVFVGLVDMAKFIANPKEHVPATVQGMVALTELSNKRFAQNGACTADDVIFPGITSSFQAGLLYWTPQTLLFFIESYYYIVGIGANVKLRYGPPNYIANFNDIKTSKAAATKDFPHKCNNCGQPAYISALSVECSNSQCQWSKR